MLGREVGEEEHQQRERWAQFHDRILEAWSWE